MLCYPACGHHWKTLSIRLLAVGFNNLDDCSGVGDTGTVLGTRTGFRAVATANMAGYCTGTRVRA